MREKLKMLQEVAQWSQSKELIKYRSQSEACVGGASLEALYTSNAMDKFII